MLERFLPSVMEYSRGADIYVVDNASTDGSVDFLKQHYPTVGIVQNSINGGFAKGYNDGLEDIEADDIISAIVQAKGVAEDQKIIMSNDKDFMQLCNDTTILMRPAKKPWEILNTKRILEDLKIHPKNMALARALVGDASDNLPGVPGIGFGRVVKFFPFLSEDEEYSAQDLFKATNDLLKEKKSKYLEAVLEHKDVIHENYKIMQLYQPSVSYQRRQMVENCLTDRDKHFNLTGFKLMLSEDGFMSLKWEVLEQTMRRIISE